MNSNRYDDLLHTTKSGVYNLLGNIIIVLTNIVILYGLSRGITLACLHTRMTFSIFLYV